MTQHPLVKFGDVVRQVKDKVDPQTAGLERYVAGEHMDTDNLHIRRWGDVGAGYLGPAFHMRFKPGQILYGSRRTYLRKIAVADFEGITANTTYVIEPKDPEVLLPDFLPFVMSTERFHEHSIKQSKGSVNPYINFSDITWYEFPLPPVDEQRRIADLLWAADDVIETKRNALISLNVLFKSTQTDLILGKQQKTAKKSSPLGEIPTHWAWTELEKLGEFSNGISKPGSEFGSGSPFINLQDVFGKMIINTLPEGRVKVSKKELISQGVLKNDILFVRSSVKREGVGLTVLIDSDWGGEEVGFAGFLIRFRLTSDVIIPKFANYLFHEIHFRRLLIGSSTESLNTNINQQQLKKLPCIIPPKEVQKEICDKLDLITENIKAIEEHIEITKVLKSKILQQYLG